jgi:DNA-binding LytR/AlgR family response regulator
MPRSTALIADDEPLLREALRRMLADAWPELIVVGEARNGREAIALVDEQTPDVCFLDVQMPGLSGIDAASHIGRRAHVVFVTAHDRYAIEAFAHGALDYLLKPVDPARLAETVTRIKARVRAEQPAINTEALLKELAAQLSSQSSVATAEKAAPLRWIRAQAGQTLRLIPVDAIDYLRSDAKYTLVAWHGEDGRPSEAVVRTPLKDLLPQLDRERFAQVHRSVVVNLDAISHVTRHENDTATVHLKCRKDVLPVSRSYIHLFKQM